MKYYYSGRLLKFDQTSHHKWKYIRDLLEFHIDDYVAEEDDIAWAIRCLFRNRSGGPSDMQAEHLCSCLAAATRN